MDKELGTVPGTNQEMLAVDVNTKQEYFCMIDEIYLS